MSKDSLLDKNKYGSIYECIHPEIHILTSNKILLVNKGQNRGTSGRVSSLHALT